MPSKGYDDNTMISNPKFEKNIDIGNDSNLIKRPLAKSFDMHELPTHKLHYGNPDFEKQLLMKNDNKIMGQQKTNNEYNKGYIASFDVNKQNAFSNIRNEEGGLLGVMLIMFEGKEILPIDIEQLPMNDKIILTSLLKRKFSIEMN